MIVPVVRVSEEQRLASCTALGWRVAAVNRWRNGILLLTL